ncbi:hypothetical protein TNCV_2739641 [Trichonephila clavipes]|nr:hypothetical protein TNCV_2739641 [Trichonephila clavipes]
MLTLHAHVSTRLISGCHFRNAVQVDHVDVSQEEVGLMSLYRSSMLSRLSVSWLKKSLDITKLIPEEKSGMK